MPRFFDGFDKANRGKPKVIMGREGLAVLKQFFSFPADESMFHNMYKYASKKEISITEEKCMSSF